MPSSSFAVSALQVWETPYSLESKGVANSMGIKHPGLKQSFIWITITMNQQQIPQMIISPESAQLIKSPGSVWAQTVSSQHTPPCSKPLWSLPWYLAVLHTCSNLNPAIEPHLLIPLLCSLENIPFAPSTRSRYGGGCWAVTVLDLIEKHCSRESGQQKSKQNDF